MTHDVRVHVEDLDSVPARGIIRLRGTVVHGEVRAGLTVTAGPAKRPSFREAIHAVESVEDGDPRRIALCFRYLDDAERDRWMAMPWVDRTIDIPASPILHPCPCCGFRTLEDAERGSFELCGVCGWEDDPVQLADVDYRGGPNGESLRQARDLFFAARPHLRSGRGVDGDEQAERAEFDF